MDRAGEQDLQRRFQELLPVAERWSGVLYRAVGVRYANSRDLLTGEGARTYGGRWNSPGAFAAVYGSLSPEIALREAIAGARYFGVLPHTALPLVIVAVELKIQAVLDLNRSDILARLSITREQLFEDDWRSHLSSGTESLSQTLGRLAWEARVEAVRVPSAAVSGGENLVVFPSRRRRGSSWKIVRPRELPRRM